MSSHFKLLVCGKNETGQAGIAQTDESILVPTVIDHITGDVSRVAMGPSQLFVVLSNGTVFTAGENDNNELARMGKRSLLQRVDALETFEIAEACIGSGFAMLGTTDGKLVGWGRNDMGQLGNSCRDSRDRPRLNNALSEPIIQISCGAQHTVALTRYGKVVSWGGNFKGQLGDGQLSSSTTPISILQLRHRPVVSITCGENHTLVMTVGGNVYSWGDNSQGQLGLGDTTHRLRPQLIKNLRSIRAKKISAGGHHSAVVSSQGLLFSFGSNTFGQCGQGSDADVRVCPSPTVVDRLRDYVCTHVACGAAHTLIIAKSIRTGLNGGSGETTRNMLFVMGLNSSGQLGLGNTNNVFSPTVLHLNTGGIEWNPTSIASGPLSRQSLIVAATAIGDNTASLPLSSQLDRNVLPAVNLHLVSSLVEAARKNTHGVNSLRASIAAAFSSISVLNASFIVNTLSADEADKTVRSSGVVAEHNKLMVDLQAVRQAYELILDTEATLPAGPQIISTLGRATMLLSEELKNCPFDDAENMAVFLIVMENPLMLRAKDFHVAIERVVSGILAVPKFYRIILFKWLKSYPSEFFGRILQVLQSYLSFAVSNRIANLSAAPVVMVLETLYQCNIEEQILPEHLFYNETLERHVNLVAEWESFKNAADNSQVFNYWSYPFLIRDQVKYALLLRDARERSLQQSYAHKRKYVSDHFLNEWIAFTSNRHGVSFQVGGAEGAGRSPSFSVSAPPQPSLPPGVAVQLDELNRFGPQQTLVFSSLSTLSSALTMYLDLTVRREHLLADLLLQLRQILTSDPSTLKLPLRVRFEGEDGVDAGGVAKELLTLAVQQLCKAILSPCSNGRSVWFMHGPYFTPADSSSAAETGLTTSHSPYSTSPDNETPHIASILASIDPSIVSGVNASAPCGSSSMLHPSYSFTMLTNRKRDANGLPTVNKADSRIADAYIYTPEYYLGVIVGLAAMNGVYVELPLPVSIYKIFAFRNNSSMISSFLYSDSPVEQITPGLLQLSDLYDVDPDLARGLQLLLDFEDGAGSIEELFQIYFTASANPLVPATPRASSGKSSGEFSSPSFVPATIELIPDGENIAVGLSNRHRFVQLFVQHALYGSCAHQVGAYLRGLDTLFGGKMVKLCSSLEIEHVLCGLRDVGDLSDLRLHTTYRGVFNDEHPVVNWFWDVLSSLSVAEKKKFLHFVTGSERVPLGGIANIGLVIQSTSAHPDSLPASHTCFSILDLPSTYTSADQLRLRLLLALEHSHGFGLV